MGSEKKSLADIDYLVAKHDREEKLPENRLKQIRELVDNALHSVQEGYPKWRTEDLLKVAQTCINRHITEITEEK